MINLPKHPEPRSRFLLVICVMVLMGLICAQVFLNRAGAQKQEEKKMETTTNPSLSGSPGATTKPSSEDLKKKLTAQQYHVTQECGTEPPFNNPYWNNDHKGIYADVITGEPLFTSLDKADSATGRLTFTKPISKDLLVQKPDNSHDMQRTEVRARRSDSHLGHVFADPTSPSGERYAVNSASFRFVPVEKMEEEGYGKYLPLLEQKK